MLNDTIGAIATPLGKGGIGIVRLSGPNAFDVVKRLFIPARRRLQRQRRRAEPTRHAKRDDFEPQSHRLYYGHIRVAKDDNMLEEVLVAFMRAPKTYTREDVVEINAHSGLACLNNIMQRLLAEDLRQANPGEFTQRAFLNGRIDLNQVEGVIDTINAETNRQLHSAQKLLAGHFSCALETVRVRLNDLIADMEATLEFGEQVMVGNGNPMMWRRLIRDELLVTVNALKARRPERPEGDDPVAVLAGSPNVGKSSLMNRLTQRERSIVTPWPGTTRDTVSARIGLNGCDVEMIDTAGIHANPEEIESIGIQRARAAIEMADVLVHVLDDKQGLRLLDEGDWCLADDALALHGKRCIIVVNKCDLLTPAQRAHLPGQVQGMPVIAASALKGDGLDAVGEALAETVRQVIIEEDRHCSGYATVRQAQHLEKICSALQDAVDAIDGGVGEDLVVIDLKNAAVEVRRMMGQSVTMDVLNAVFDRFCIGK